MDNEHPAKPLWTLIHSVLLTATGSLGKEFNSLNFKPIFYRNYFSFACTFEDTANLEQVKFQVNVNISKYTDDGYVTKVKWELFL